MKSPRVRFLPLFFLIPCVSASQPRFDTAPSGTCKKTVVPAPKTEVNLANAISRTGTGTSSTAVHSPSSGSADSSEGSPTTRDDITWYTLFQRIPQDWSNGVDHMFREERTVDWAILSGLTAALVVTDDATYSPSKRFYESSSDAKRWSDFFAEIGDGRSQFALAGGFAAYGLALGDQKALRTGVQIAEVVLASGAVIQVLKHLTGRESPFVRTSPTGIWKILPNQVDYHRYVPYFDAFPSGHICTSLATVIVIAENYPDITWIRPLGYALTALVGIGMANNGIHWYSDYPLGLFIGYYFGMIASHPAGFNDRADVSAPGPRISLRPSFTTSGVGIDLAVRF